VDTSIEERNCQLCGSAKKSVHYPAKLPPKVDQGTLHSQYSSGDHWHYQSVRCQDCGHFFASPVFSEKLTDDSYVMQQHDNEFGQDVRLLMKTNGGYVDAVGKHHQGGRGTMLDIGCDIGRFIEASHKLNFAKYVGVEPSQASVNKAVKLPNTKYIQGTFKPSMFQPGEFDLITMIHVLDHLRQPKEFLQATRPLLSNGGTLFAVVHNIDSLVAKISGSEWHPFNLIHFDYYTEKTLAELFKRAGYRVLATFRTKNYIDFQQIFLRAPFIPGPLRRFLVKISGRAPINKIFLKIPLGNIGIVAQKEQ